MKNKYITLLFTLAISLLSGSCGKFLDVVPSNIAVIEEAFETRDNAERFLATLYNYLPAYVSDNNPAMTAGDEIAVNENVSRTWAGHILSRGGQNKVGPLLGYWGNTGSVRNLFIALRDCNIFLENVDKPFDILPNEMERWTAEAKILKAYFHFYLLRMYGPIPLVRQNIEVSEGLDAVRVSRDPVDEVNEYIVELLDEAIANPELPLTITDVGTELGRLTKVAAYALKAKVLVTAASPLFNGNSDYASFTNKDGTPLFATSYDENKWIDAVQACKEAIEVAEMNGHNLFTFNKNELPNSSDSTYTKLTVRGAMTEPWNNELLWGGSNSTFTAGFQARAQAKINPLLTAESRESTSSFWSPPLRIAELFYSSNGVPITEDKNYDYANRYATATATADYRYYIKEGKVTAKLNFDREPRFYGFLGFDTGIWEGHGQLDKASYFVEAKRGQRAGILDATRYSLSGYFAKKIVHYEAVQSAPNSGYSAERYPFPIIRLADLYLLYAESLNEVGRTAEAYPWIDKIRERAGLKGVVESWREHSQFPDKPLNKEGFRDIIQQERLIELSFEGHRLWDLRRWKKAEIYMNAPIRGWNIQGEDTESYYNILVYGRYQFSSRDYFWPISETDILANPNLVQNPGW
ncbi:putative outer membrane starch-binding protein [Dyadobacter jejuensis]|uniref:Putative outer membrane starch-binding protein n=1 Tax=Dyadobacter jejuensis TaxID=1082580 RepID=A0A316AL18_9BACT|nr:RagB/SusD family nutrient uptake outer membrane protein [Dyadobacter jejuensis]PWJ57949.1 putative outer membrane starch-binding protein [Dyadobacter jejuensis]